MTVFITVLAAVVAAWLIAWLLGQKKKRPKYTRSMWTAVAASVILTGFVAILLLNLSNPEKHIAHKVDVAYSVADPQFDRVMGNLLGPTLVNANRIQTLVNGDQAFPSMLEAIRSAKKTITFEMFIYWRGEIGRVFAEAISERARAGVKCHVLLDAIGSAKMDPKLVKSMQEAGVEVERYHPIAWYTIDRVNNRTHRKIIVVDGVVGFIGGMGIGDEWTGNAQDPKHWRDTHYRVEGPVVGQLQTAFMDNWVKTHSEVLHDASYFPKIPETTGSRAQVFRSSYEEGSENARIMFLMSVAAARKSVIIESPYFIPDSLCLEALVDAAKRGVKVEVVTTGEITDEKMARYASKARWGKMLEAGIKIYEYQPTFIHSKVFVVDSLWSSVGSLNMDNRSFHLNDEANLNVLDPAFAKQQIDIIERDKQKSREYTMNDWKKRTFWDKFREQFSSLFQSQL